MGRPGIFGRVKNGLFIPLLWFSSVLCLSAQEKYVTRTGTIHFEASVPSFEEVDATTHSTSAVLDVSTGEFAALVLVKSFRFKIALMEEHFNENYIMSAEYPRASFRGRIEGPDIQALDNTPVQYSIPGELTLRGTTKAITVPASLQKKGDRIILKSSFTTTPGDFGIKIPGIVRNKIAREVTVNVHFELE